MSGRMSEHGVPIRIAAIVLGLGLALGTYTAVGRGMTESSEAQKSSPGPPETEKALGHIEKATFAGGCFWCMEPPFDRIDGVVSTTSGYIGGRTKSPSYREVSAGGSGHAEAVEIVYDSSKVSYRDLLDVFWRNIDPLAVDRQFCDRGDQYRSAIFVHDGEQGRLAEESKRALAESGVLAGGIVTEIEMAGAFWPAEEYHQDYYQKNPIRYKYYRRGCGRDRRLKELWK